MPSRGPPRRRGPRRPRSRPSRRDRGESGIRPARVSRRDQPNASPHPAREVPQRSRRGRGQTAPSTRPRPAGPPRARTRASSSRPSSTPASPTARRCHRCAGPRRAPARTSDGRSGHRRWLGRYRPDAAARSDSRDRVRGPARTRDAPPPTLLPHTAPDRRRCSHSCGRAAWVSAHGTMRSPAPSHRTSGTRWPAAQSSVVGSPRTFSGVLLSGQQCSSVQCPRWGDPGATQGGHHTSPS